MLANVYRTALQAAYQQPLADKLNVMAAFDVVWTGDNAEYLYQARHTNLQQSAQYNTQVGLNYVITPTYEIAASYFYTVGAEGTIDGLKQDNEKNTSLSSFCYSQISSWTLHSTIW
jgi:hypothetical protein